jgi:CHAT domain-containing protein/tetratricopeptide (TPR) repeat protein
VRDYLLRLNQHPGIVASLVQIAEETGDEQALAFGRLFSARLLEQQLNYREAKQGYEQAVGLFEKLKMTEWQATSLNDLAIVCRDQGDTDEARKLSQQALKLFKQVHGERHPIIATMLNNLGVIYHKHGDFQQALELYQHALNLLRERYGEQHADVANTLDNLGTVYYQQGELREAQKLCQRALDLRKQLFSAPHPDIALSLSHLGMICCAMEELPKARKLHERALVLYKQLHDGERHPDVARSMNHLAAVYYAENNLPEARKLCQRVLELRRQLYGERHPEVATALNNRAEVCRLQLAQRLLELRRQLHGERHLEVATFLNNLAEVCRLQRDLDQTRKLFLDAVELCKHLYGDRHPTLACTLHNLAKACTDQMDLTHAVEYSMAAVLASRLPRVDHVKLTDLRPDDLVCNAETVQVLHYLGWILSFSCKAGDRTTARQAAHAYALAATLLDRLRSDMLQTDEGKLIQGARRDDLIPERVRLAAMLFGLDHQVQDLHTAFTAIEQGRARVFLEALGRARSHQIGGVPESQLQQECDLLAHIRAIEGRIETENGKTLGQRNADLVVKLFDELKAKRDKLKEFAARLRQDYPQYAALQYPSPCTLDQARDCLGYNEVAVLFALDRNASYAVVVQKQPARGDKGQGVAIVSLPSSDVLEQKVRSLVGTLQSDSRCRELGAQLFDLLLKPLAPHTQGKDLVLAPDGVLWELPFELLVEGRTGDEDETRGKYLIESRQVRYTPSLTVLHLISQWEGKRQAPTEPLWALGDPIFSKDDPRAKGDLHAETRHLLERYALRGARGSTWNRLPATRKEVLAIADLHGMGEDEVVKDAAACEKVIKTASKEGILSRKRYLHLATHGILGVGLGRQPSLVLSLVGNDGTEELGGVNDGFLTLEEVTHLKLNADLVVLSACETGKGDLQPAEGVVGLSRAFLYAGSRGVVCSL